MSNNTKDKPLIWSKKPIKKRYKHILNYKSKLSENEKIKIVDADPNFKDQPLSEIRPYKQITDTLNSMQDQLQSMIDREIKRIDDTFEDSINPEREALFTKIAKVKYDIKQLVDNYSNISVKL